MTQSLLLSGIMMIGGGVYMKQNPQQNVQTVSSDTQVYSWGGNIFGQLGQGNENNYYTPQKIEALSGKKVVQLSVQQSVSSALTKDGQIYTWGKNKGSLLGNTDQTGLNSSLPYLLKISGQKFQDIKTGPNHMIAITQDGQVYSWGNEDHGKLGQGQQTVVSNKITSFSPQRTLESGKGPTLVDGLPPGQQFISAACGQHHSLILSEDGEVYSFGQNKQGCTLGYETVKTYNEVPTKIQALNEKQIIKIDSGTYYSFALTSDGELYSWGTNQYGQLGNSGIMNKGTPTQILQRDGDSQAQIVDFSCGDFFMGSVSSDGKVFTWGYGNDGQLGHATRSDIYSPKRLEFDQKIKKISCGGGHLGIISYTDQLYLIGRGRQGQLGRGSNIESQASYRTFPRLVDFFGNQKVLQVACGGEHTLAILQK